MWKDVQDTEEEKGMIHFLLPFMNDEETEDRNEALYECLESLDSQDNRDFRLTVVHYESVFDWDILKGLDFTTDIYQMKDNRFFSFGTAINTAVPEVCQPDDVIAVIGSDFIFPSFYTKAIVKELKLPGYAFFPICYSLHKEKPREIYGSNREVELYNGWWREEGWGLYAIHHCDFEMVGGMWDNKTWGGEDNEFYGKCINRNMQIVRYKMVGLFHLWHPEDKEYKGRFYEET